MPYANREDQLAYHRDRRQRLRNGEAPGVNPATPTEGCHFSRAQWQALHAHLDRLIDIPLRGDSQRLVSVQRETIEMLQRLIETLAPVAPPATHNTLKERR